MIIVDFSTNDEILTISGVSAIDSENFSSDYNILNNGDTRVVFFTISGDGIESGNAGTVVNLHFDGSDILSGFFSLDAFNLTVSDEDGTIVNSQINDGSITNNIEPFNSSIREVDKLIKLSKPALYSS